MKRLISIFALLLSACAAFAVESGDDVMRLTPIGYRLGEAGGVTAYDQSVVTVTPVDTSIVYSNKAVTLTAALDRDYKRPNENPSVGIILCPSADKAEVEYSLCRSMSPTMVAEYKRVLIPREVMKKSLAEYCEFLKKENKK